ncbi:MAG TPA: AAA family ATPase [Anaerolineales bacterium]
MLFYISAFQKPVSRDTLVDAFWPEKSLDKARMTLADTLSKLRADLRDKSILVVTQSFITLNRDLVSVDWLDFCNLMAQIEKTPGAFTQNQVLSANLYQKMSAAVTLWNQRELIENDEVALTSTLDTWLTGIRSECNEFLKRVLPRLGQHETTAGNHDQAIYWLELAHQLDEYDDGINLALVEAYINAHRYAEARGFFQEIKEYYSDGLDEDLPEFMQALEARLQFSHPTVPTGDHPNWSIQPGLSVPFIGQKNALAELNSFSQRGGVVIVLGDAGSGKTRLVHEFCRQRGKGMHLLVASCQPLETSMPFAPWISLLRTSIPEETWKKLDATWAAPLTLLLPELFNIREDLQSLPPGRPETFRTVLLEAVYQVIRLLARKDEVILFLDDAQWADESSLALISYLIKKSLFSPGNGLLILAARVEHKNPLLDEFLMSIHPEPLRRVHTQLFNEEELAELCYFVFSRNVPLKFLEKLYQDTGGNAFFSTQVLQAFLEENPDPNFENVDALPMPAAISDAIQRKFRVLSQPAQEVISTAAVLGSQFEIELLEAALTLTTEEFLLALEELEQAQIIHPVRKGGLVFSFVHEKLREGLLIELNQNRKRLLHHRLALALESHASANSSARASLLAYHFEQAGMYIKAFDALVLAAQHARQLMAISDAMDACQQAERLIHQNVGISDAQVYKMYRLWSQIAYENDTFEIAESVNLSLHNLGKERNNPLMIGSALTGLSDAEMSRNQFEKALEYASQALEYVRNTDNAFEQARALNRSGVYTYMLGHIRESQPFFWKALELTKIAHDVPFIYERCNSFNRLAVTDTLLGFPVQGLENAQKSLLAAQEFHIIYEQISAYNTITLANYMLTSYSLGREAALRGIELARRVGSWRMLGYLCCYISLCETELGMLADAWEHSQTAIQIGRRQGHGEIVSLGYRVLGDIYFHLDALELAGKAYQQGIISAGKHFVALENMIRYGHVLAKSGEASGRQTLLQALKTAAEAELGALTLPGTLLELAIYLQTGEIDLFEKRATWLRDQVRERSGQDFAEFAIRRVKAEDHFAKKEYQQAYEQAQACIDWYRQKQNAWHELNLSLIMENSAQHLEIEHASLRPRMLELLDGLENSLQESPLQSEWQDYRIKFSL